ncbi:MAG TPA: hypothetical protein VFQ53_03040 [Kofleriaceae bacterium]|nr:hypothetical protein [Kofleriaceae bacterium]
MSELPIARIAGRSSPRPYLKKLVLAGVAIGAVGTLITLITMRPPDRALEQARKAGTARALVDYAREGDRDAARDELARLHGHVRDTLRSGGANPGGLDGVLAPLLDQLDTRLRFVGDQTIDRASFAALAPRLTTAGSLAVAFDDELSRNTVCDDGLTRAFAAMTGNDTIEARTSADSKLRVEMTWVVHATVNRFVVRGTVYPGVRYTGRLRIVDGDRVLAAQDFDVTPPAPDVLALANDPAASEGDVARAISRSACKQAGLAVLGKLTGWTPHAQPSAVSLLDAQCATNHSTACLLAGRDQRGRDPASAEVTFRHGCGTEHADSSECCREAAALAVSRGDSAAARTDLFQACYANDGESCARHAILVLGDRPSQALVDGALPELVRACELGVDRGCERAAALFASPGYTGRPSRAASAVLAHHTCGSDTCPRFAMPHDARVLGIPAGADEVFDVRWEQCDGRPLAVIWVASTASKQSVLARMRGSDRVHVYAAEDAPYQLSIPEEATTVWGVTSEPWPEDGCLVLD